MREEKYILRWKAFLPAAGMALVSAAVIAAASFLVPEGGRQGEAPPQAESGGDAAGFDISRMEDADFSAVITSDLHFRDHAAPSQDPASGMDRIVPLTQTFLSQVKALHPDVLILCGDNTDIGDGVSMELLNDLLSDVEDAGITVVMCPGNHDFDASSRGLYEAAFPFAYRVEGGEEKKSRDGSSLSYALTVKGTRLLVMDDQTEGHNGGGAYSEETLRWLERELAAARDAGEEILFITHHNVLREATADTGKTPSGAPYLDPFYYVQDPGLPELLSEYGVRLILSGHRHAQEIRRHSGDGSYGPLFEIISSPLSSWPFAFGLLCADEGALSYRTEPLDFASYGAPYGTSGIQEEYGENARSAAYAPLFEELFSKAPLSRNDRAGAEALLLRFLEYKACGTLAAHRAEIAADPYCRKLLSALEGTNYGPWIRYEMETAALPGNALFIPAGGKSP